MNLFITDWKKWAMATKDILDIWDAIRSIRDDIAKIKDQNMPGSIDFLNRSYSSIIERLEAMQKDFDSLKK